MSFPRFALGGGAWLWVSILMVPLAAAQGETHALPDERLGIRTAPLLLLSRADVCDDLGLTADQRTRAETAITDLYVRAAALKGQTGAQALAGRRAIDEAQKAWVETHLNPAQRDRLVQIDLQWEGPSALISRPLVGETVGLSPEQRDTLKAAVAACNAARAARQPTAAAEHELSRQTLALLDPAQKERWRSLLGRPFAPKLAGRGAEAPRR